MKAILLFKKILNSLILQLEISSGASKKYEN